MLEYHFNHDDPTSPQPHLFIAYCDRNERAEMFTWAKSEFGESDETGRWWGAGHVFYFAEEKDALLFRLRFG